MMPVREMCIEWETTMLDTIFSHACHTKSKLKKKEKLQTPQLMIYLNQSQGQTRGRGKGRGIQRGRERRQSSGSQPREHQQQQVKDQEARRCNNCGKFGHIAQNLPGTPIWGPRSEASIAKWTTFRSNHK